MSWTVRAFVHLEQAQAACLRLGITAVSLSQPQAWRTVAGTLVEEAGPGAVATTAFVVRVGPTVTLTAAARPASESSESESDSEVVD
jgi:hypothetical protein